MATATRRATPPTHPTVWAGLALAIVGLVVALYAYTGSRVYDVTFAVVAVLGGILALGGILTSAWGRAVMAARASRSRRSTIKDDAMKLGASMKLDEAPPTIAEPPSKKRLSMPATAGGFRFNRKMAAPPVEPSPALEAALDAAEAPPLERVTLKCPQCATRFTSEGTRPFTATCPQCAFSAQV